MCNQSLPSRPQPVLESAHRRKVQANGKPVSVLTKIDVILEMRNLAVNDIERLEDIQPGQGYFRVKWEKTEKVDWVDAADVVKHGASKIDEYVGDMRLLAKLNQLMNELTHISSLNDIVPGYIVEERGRSLKVRIVSLGYEFLKELQNEECKRPYTPNFKIIREGRGLFVWMDRIALSYMYDYLVADWDSKQRQQLPPVSPDVIAKAEAKLEQQRRDYTLHDRTTVHIKGSTDGASTSGPSSASSSASSSPTPTPKKGPSPTKPASALKKSSAAATTKKSVTFHAKKLG